MYGNSQLTSAVDSNSEMNSVKIAVFLTFGVGLLPLTTATEYNASKANSTRDNGNDVNCGKSCSWDGYCASFEGPCGICHQGTCRAASRIEAMQAHKNAKTPDRQCAAQWCYEDKECPDLGCEKCSPPISPLPYGICLSTPYAKNANRTLKKTPNSCAAQYCTSDVDCMGAGDCVYCSPPAVPGGPRVCIP